jgi:Ca-activated chloride channel homolog
MIFTMPWGLLGLLAVPAIVAIHLFRRRFPTRSVAGLFLWQVMRRTPETGGRISKLPITASLLLECLAAFALALILAGARLRPATVSQHVVVLLDNSASMAATNSLGQSPRDRAVRRVLNEIAQLGSSGRITLVESGERPSVILGPAAFAAEARSALEKWKPDAPHHSLALGLQLAREIAGRQGRLLVLSDTSNGDNEVEGAVWVAVGEALANVGFTAAQRTISPEQGTGTIFLSIGNFSTASLRRHLRVFSGTDEVLARELDLPPGTSSFNLPLRSGLSSVRVVLSDDPLLRDNEIVLAEPRPKVVAVKNRLPQGRGRDALMKALSSISGVTTSEHEDIRFEPAGELNALVPAGGWPVAFGRAPADLFAAGDTHDFVGPFVPEKLHPLMRGVTLAGVVWTGAYSLAPGKIHPLVSAGDQALIALLGSRPEDGILFNIDLERTNLIRSPDWPILVSNLIELRRQNLPGPEFWNYRIGEWVRVRLGRQPKGPLQFRCGAIERELPVSNVSEFIAPAPGGLLQVMEGNQVLFEVGVNFLDEEESNLQHKEARESGKFDSHAADLRGENGPASDPLFWILLGVATAAVLLNWCVGATVTRHA